MTHRVDLVLFACYLVSTLRWGSGWPGAGRRIRGLFSCRGRVAVYAIGGSIIAANISTEHFIGMIGIAYAVGFVWPSGNGATGSRSPR